MTQQPYLHLNLTSGGSSVSRDGDLTSGSVVHVALDYSLRALERFFYPGENLVRTGEHTQGAVSHPVLKPVYATVYLDGAAEDSFDISTPQGAAALRAAAIRPSDGVHRIEVGLSTEQTSPGSAIPSGGLTTGAFFFTEGNGLRVGLESVQVSPLVGGSSTGTRITAQEEANGFRISGTLAGAQSVLKSIKTVTVEILSPAGATVGEETFTIGEANPVAGAFSLHRNGATFSVDFPANLPFPVAGEGYQIEVSVSDGTHSANLLAAAEAYCFCEGVMILTPEGEKPVESLATGDLVVTADGRSLPVRWVGTQEVVCAFADTLRLQPVRIRAGAFDDNVPSRDLLVSPDHALFLDGVLIQAAALVNGETVVRDPFIRSRFTYYHLELEEHALVIADGAAAETFIDNVDRMAFDNWAEHEALGLARAPLVEMPYPRAKSHRQTPTRVRQRLARRAEALRADAVTAA